MIKKIFFISFIIIFISGCGYTPIYSKKDQNFKLGKIETSGNTKLNKIIIRNIKSFTKKNTNSSKIFNLKMETKLNKNVKSKDTKGNPKTFEIKIVTKLIVNKDKTNSLQKSFSYSSTYNTLNSEFELKIYEKTVEKYLLSKISEKIIVYFQTL
jgi:hypothetical protein